jgi:hypothetical protein
MQVTISFDKPAKYRSGGLAQKAQEVRDAGRNGDSILVHVNPEEYDFLKQNFGGGSTNPQTGLPQFNIWDILLPAAANIFLPGVGGSIGNMIGGLGVGSDLANLAGNAIVGGGISALTGGVVATGAISGGLSGPVLSSLGLTGSGGALSGLNLMPTAASAAPAAASAATGYNPTAVGNGMGGIGGVAGGAGITASIMKAAPLLLAMASLGNKSEPATPPQVQTDPNMSTHLTPVKFERTRLEPVVTTRYGFGPEQSFFKDNSLPAAEGRYVKGGGTGTSDDIPARLSDGEYVIDAQTVSMLGDGSSDAGAQKLDAMREQIRKHKGAALAQGKFAPNAKGPLSYMKGA